MKKRANFAQRT